ncbi:MAG: hypothetical protein Q9225_005270 [Loekoesia sp. 1 TL-2023]
MAGLPSPTHSDYDPQFSFPPPLRTTFIPPSDPVEPQNPSPRQKRLRPSTNTIGRKYQLRRPLRNSEPSPSTKLPTTSPAHPGIKKRKSKASSETDLRNIRSTFRAEYKKSTPDTLKETETISGPDAIPKLSQGDTTQRPSHPPGNCEH